MEGIPVLSENKQDVVFINYDDILIFRNEGYDYAVITKAGIKYFWALNNEMFEKFPGFERTDRSSVIRMDHVVRYDNKLKTFHFSDKHEPYVNVSRKNQKRLKLD